ncbi:hypothetical protein B0T14DRAFT_529264 [Immersiella caudata]|uniref:F-box domain-containing protein n=1 Tax=Immersiella caudata TaxID=314043 RepID=A0AA39WCQ2_9PEZI|nr:hypothetical protein B0T14DRAFT_529264 [Immersiella caudata]
MEPFLAAPTEVIVKVFQQCDSLADITALRLACRHLNSVWLSHSPVVIGHAGPRLIPAYSRALMAVRATAVVHAAHAARELPPEIDPEEFDRASQLPNLTRPELEALLGLQHLARCVEVRFLNHPCTPLHLPLSGEQWPPDRVPPPPQGTPEPAFGMAEWRERLHGSIYTSLFLGAVLARAYNEPFFPNELTSSEPVADHYRIDLLRTFRTWSLSKTDDFKILPSHCDYLSRFPVYKLDLAGDTPDGGGPFTALDRWLVSSSLRQARVQHIPSRFLDNPGETRFNFFIERHPYNGVRWVVPWQEKLSQMLAGEPAHVAAGVLRVILQYLWMSEFLLTCFENVDGEEGQGRPESAHGYGDFVPEVKKAADVVLFGIFRAERVSTLKKSKDSASRPFRAQSLRLESPLPGVFQPDDLDIPAISEALYMRSGVPNHQRSHGVDYLIPPPPLQFFIFSLSKHFRLTIHFTPDQEPFEPTNYVYFTSSAAIFANVGLGIPGRGGWPTSLCGMTLLMDTLRLDGDRRVSFKAMDWNPRYYAQYERYGDSSYDNSEGTRSQDSE